MVSSEGGYFIRQEIQRNRIVIDLPQTFDTCNSTASPISFKRRISLTAEEEASILMLVKSLFEANTEHDCCYWQDGKCILGKTNCPDDYSCANFD